MVVHHAEGQRACAQGDFLAELDQSGVELVLYASRCLCAHEVCEDTIQCLAAEITMTIAVDACEVVSSDSMAAKSCEDTANHFLSPPVNGGKPGLQC